MRTKELEYMLMFQNINLKGNTPCNQTETIASKDKRIEELEQGINDLKSQLQKAQQQITNLIRGKQM